MKKRTSKNWLKMNLKSTSNYLEYHEVDIPKTILGVIAILLLLWGLFGCSAQKKIDKATQIVLINEEARDKVFERVLAIRPCSNDTAWKIIKGGVDSIPYPVIVSDPALRDYLIDSLAIDQADAWNEAVDDLSAEHKDAIKATAKKWYDKGYGEAQKEIAKLKLAVSRPDTLQGTITTHALENILKAQLAAKEIANGVLTGEKQQLKERVKSQMSWLWWLIAVSSVCVVTNLLWAYRAIKKKPAKLLGV